MDKFGRLYVIGIVVIYICLVATGITGSSISILTGSESSISQNLVGRAQPIRSDEFLRSSPMLIGGIKAQTRHDPESKPTLITPLDSDYKDQTLEGDQISTQTSVVTGVITQISQIDSWLLSHLPLTQQFAARWWLSSFYLFIGVFLIFTAIKISWHFAFLASALMWVSAPNQWWSLWPMDSVGTSALCVGLILVFVLRLNNYFHSVKKKNLRGTLVDISLVLSAVVLSMKLLNMYAPWAFSVALFFAVLAVSSLFLIDISKKIIYYYLIPFSAITISLLIPYVMTIKDRIEMIAGTVYPGARRFSGGADFPLWSGPFAWLYQTSRGASTNQSEFAVGLLILIPVSVLLIVDTKRSESKHQNYSNLTYPILFLQLIYLLWVSAPWPKGLVNTLGVARFPPIRIMQILGVLAPLLFVIALYDWRRRRTGNLKVILVGSLLLIFLFTLQDGFLLFKRLGLTVNPTEIWLVALVTTILILTTIFAKKEKLSLSLLLVVCSISVLHVNPVTRGIGVFGNSLEMKVIEEAHSLDDGRWASDNFIFDSLPTGAGMRMLSGNQGQGPNWEAYRLLDPDLEFENNWNRGGSYVYFNWTSNDQVSFANTGEDVIIIQIDPCNTLLNDFDLSWIVSSTDLSANQCLKFFKTLEFQGQRYNIYSRYQERVKVSALK